MLDVITGQVEDRCAMMKNFESLAAVTVCKCSGRKADSARPAIQILSERQAIAKCGALTMLGERNDR